MEFWIFAAGLTSLALGGAMTLFGWNVIRQNRRRENARTALLSQMAFPGGMPRDVVTDPPIDPAGWIRVDESGRESSDATQALFSEPEPSGAASRRTAALAAVSGGFAILIGAYWWFASADTSSAAPASATPAEDSVASATTVSVPSPVQTAPRVELLSLTYRATPGAFLVTGQVRNPSGGAPLNDIVAVVEVMDDTGRVLMTVRAPLKRRELNAGEGSEFSVSASKATNVRRYRVEFHNAANVVIPQVDRRQQRVISRSG